MNVCRRALALLAIGIMIAATPRPSNAQYVTRTWLDWQTVETPHFAFHYPAELEIWARGVASRMEGVDSAVSAVVGFSPERRIHVVIDDPYSISNGSAWPFLDSPALLFWATPPNPREDIGTYVSWADMLSSHEFAHLAHLTRPSRNAGVRALWKLLPVDLGPIGQKVPRWVTEGYATYVEGIITNSGRPNGSWRPAILRQWAIEGKLPPYEELSSYGGMYGGDFAYLAGSAFIDWLAARQGDSSLVHLWRRLSARVDRGFDDAFTGVYGEPPSILYGRFTAEVTTKATAIQRAVGGALPDSGRTLQHLVGETGDPAISTDGSRVALMVPSAGRPPKVVIWKTLADPDTASEREQRDLAKSDPEDVAPIHLFPRPRKPLSALVAVGNQPYQGPRFFRDGRLLVWRNAAVGDGSYAPDLFIWDPQRRSVKRVTRDANLREGDPAPDGRTATALRCGGGHCDLVAVDIRSGDVRVIAAGSDTRSFYRPRFASSGQSILASVHDAGRWRLAFTSVSDGSVRFISREDDGNWFDGAFADDTTIIATTDRSGIPTIVRLRLADGTSTPVARVTGAAVGGEINPADHTVWFLALHARGWDLRSAPLNGPSVALPPLDPSLSPAAPTASRTPRSPAQSPIGSSHAYGLGPRKWLWIPGTVDGADGLSATAALVNSDVVGRHEVLIQGALGSRRSWKGVSATLTSRSSRWPWSASIFSTRQQRTPPSFAASGATMDGMSLAVRGAQRLETTFRRVMIGGTAGRLALDSGVSGSRSLGVGSVALGRSSSTDGRRTSAQVGVEGAAGQSQGARVSRVTASLSFEHTGAVTIPLTLNGSVGSVSAQSPFERFSVGGLPNVLVDQAFLSQRVLMPAIPAGVVTGTRLVQYRAAIPRGGFQVYQWGARVTGGTDTRWNRVRGIEWSGGLPTIPTIGTPAITGTVGIATWLTSGQSTRPTRAYVVVQFGDWAR